MHANTDSNLWAADMRGLFAPLERRLLSMLEDAQRDLRECAALQDATTAHLLTFPIAKEI